jgi:hypothetical protein
MLPACLSPRILGRTETVENPSKLQESIPSIHRLAYLTYMYNDTNKTMTHLSLSYISTGYRLPIQTRPPVQVATAPYSWTQIPSPRQPPQAQMYHHHRLCNFGIRNTVCVRVGPYELTILQRSLDLHWILQVGFEQQTVYEGEDIFQRDVGGPESTQFCNANLEEASDRLG